MGRIRREVVCEVLETKCRRTLSLSDIDPQAAVHTGTFGIAILFDILDRHRQDSNIQESHDWESNL